MSRRALADGLPVPKGAGPAPVYEELLKAGMPEDSVLVLTAEVVDERRALFKIIKAQGVVIDCGVGPKKDYATQMSLDVARDAIRQAVAAARKTIDRAAGEYILERTGLSMRALASELEKLVLFVGPRTEIGLADAAAVLSGSREAGIFDLTNALAERDAARALRALRSLLARREPAVMLLGLAAAEVRNLVYARGLIDEKLGEQFDGTMSFGAFQARVLPRLQAGGEPVADDERGQKAKPPLPGIHPFRLYSQLRCAAGFSPAQLLAALDAVAEADLALKTSGQPESLVLEGLLLRICAC
jgi:DNA polymerase-3 subunit delta